MILIELFLFFYIGFIIYLFSGLLKLKRKKFTQKKLKVSIIIPFNNEEKNIKRLINSLLSQTYEKELFEVIFVNDNSNDNSINLINEAIAENPNFRLLSLTQIDNNLSPKKQAIELGIKNAKNEIIVSTDADCWHDKNWLQSLVNCFDEETGFVTGLVKYENTKTFFEKLQKLEFASLLIVGASLIAKKFPVLANGANCAYRKKLFFEVDGFRDNLKLASGDEEFLMQKIFLQTKYKIEFCFNKDSFTYTEPNKNLAQFLNQRKRWSSKVLFYKNKEIIKILLLIYSFYFILTAYFIFGFFYFNYMKLFFFSFILKILFDFIFLFTGLKIFGDRKSLLLLPIAEILHLPYILITPVLGTFGKFIWKGRYFKK